MQQRLVANGYIIPQREWVTPGVIITGVRDVQHRSVLNAAAIPDPDLVHVPTYDRHGPDGDVITGLDIANHHGTGINPGALSKMWRDTLV